MNITAGGITYAVWFGIAILVLVIHMAIHTYLWGKPSRTIDQRVFGLVALGTIPLGITAALYDFSHGFRALWVAGAIIAFAVWFYICLIGPIFYTEGKFKDSWLDLWYQLIDSASWNHPLFPYGRKLRTLKQATKAGHFDIQKLPFTLWINRLLGIGSNREKKG